MGLIKSFLIFPCKAEERNAAAGEVPFLDFALEQFDVAKHVRDLQQGALLLLYLCRCLKG